MQTIYIESFDENVTPEASYYEKIVIRKPRLPKIAKVKRFKQIGHRRWSTIYQIKDSSSNILYSSEVLLQAVKHAKELAIKNIQEYYITIGKTLVGSDNRVAIITPGKHLIGRYKFLCLPA